MNDTLLFAWLMVDVVWGAFLFAGVSYLIFWRGHSPLWLLVAILLGPAFGGGGLYKALRLRFVVPLESTDADGDSGNAPSQRPEVQKKELP
jgi:hypothetical protein